jgi:hypothetical protein
MSPEIDLLNTYPVCGHESTDNTLYHVEIQKDWEGRHTTIGPQTGTDTLLPLAFLVSCVLVVPIGSAQEVTAREAALQHFQKHVAAYVTLRDRVTAAVPELAVTPHAATLQKTTDSLARAIRTARRNARRGDVFTADVARQFRGIINSALRQHGISPADALADVKEELDEGRTSGQRPTLAINARFAWGSGSAMRPEIVAALPALPEALEYTFVNRDLLLVDAGADLVVDILPRAIQRR